MMIWANVTEDELKENPAAVERTLVYALDVEEIAGKRKEPK